MNVQSRIREPHAAAAGLMARSRGRLRRRAGLIGFLVAVLLAAGWYFAFGGNAEPEAEPIIVTAVKGDVENLVTALGNLQPINSVDVGAQVSGQLKVLNVEVGAAVEQGQLLAEINSAVMSARVEAGTANLQNLRAQFAERESQLALQTAQADRQTRLLRDNATSQEAFDLAQAARRTAESQVKIVQAQINQSQATLRADQATLGYSKIYAPISGSVTSIVAKRGQTLNANQSTPTILTIADLTTMTVSTQVSEADVPRLKLGMEAYFTTLGTGGQRWTGRLRQILPTPTVLNNVVLYTALFDVDNSSKQLMTQMTAQVFFVLSAAHDAVTVPVAAIQYARPGGQANGQAGAGAQGAARGEGGAVTPRPATVTVVHDDGTQEVREVMVGVTDRVNAAIVSGLAEGESVIAGNQIGGGGGGRGGGGQNNAGRGAPARAPVLFGG